RLALASIARRRACRPMSVGAAGDACFFWLLFTQRMWAGAAARPNRCRMLERATDLGLSIRAVRQQASARTICGRTGDRAQTVGDKLGRAQPRQATAPLRAGTGPLPGRAARRGARACLAGAVWVRCGEPLPQLPSQRSIARDVQAPRTAVCLRRARP